MDALELMGYLRQVPLFSRLSDRNLERVAAILQTEIFPRGNRLAAVGQPGRAFHYILSGEAVVRAALAKGRLRPVGYLRAGSFFGVTSLLLGEPHDTSIEATADLTALVLYRADLDRLLAERPEIQDQLVLPEEINTKLHHERFDWLGPAEVVVFLERRHWFVFAQAMVPPTLVLLILSALLVAALRAQPPVWWAVCFGVLLVGYGFAVAWYLLDWRNDYFVVTTQRVVHRELILYVYEARYEAPLSQVQDVTVKRSRLGNILGFGDTIIQTAAKIGAGAITFDHLPNPEEAKTVIFRQIYRSLGRARESQQQTMRAELKRQLHWQTPEELVAEGQARKVTEPGGPAEPKPPSLQRKIRLIPPLREQSDGSITWRKHWFFLMRRILHWLLASAILIVLFVGYVIGRLPFLPPSNLGVVLGALVLAIVIGFNLWYQVTDWGNDVYIVTNDRLIDVEKHPIFGPEERRETTLDRVQNVNLVIPGPLASLLNFGNVNIDTAGGQGQFTFTHVMAPHDVQREIMSRANRLREQRSQIESQQRRREIADWFAIYEGLRQERQAPPVVPDEAPEDEEGEEG